ncbi:hypothetical protein ACMFMF_008715 [Clarireedia jacksonii]
MVRKLATKEPIIDTSETGSSNRSSTESSEGSSFTLEAVSGDANDDGEEDEEEEEDTYIRKDLEDCAMPWSQLSSIIYYIDPKGATELPRQTGFQAPDPSTPCPTWGTPECADFIGRARDAELSPWLSVYTEESTARKLADVDLGDRVYKIFVPRLQQAGNRIYSPGLMIYNHIPKVQGLALVNLRDTELFILHKISRKAVLDRLVLRPQRGNPQMNDRQISLLAAREDYFKSKTLPPPAPPPAPPPKPEATEVSSGHALADSSFETLTLTLNASSDSSYKGNKNSEARTETQPTPAKTGRMIIKLTIKKKEKLKAILTHSADSSDGHEEETTIKVNPKEANMPKTPNISAPGCGIAPTQKDPKKFNMPKLPNMPAPSFGIAPTPSASQSKPLAALSLPNFTIPKQTSRSGRKLQPTKKRAAAEISTDTEVLTRIAPAQAKNDIELPSQSNMEIFKKISPKPPQHQNIAMKQPRHSKPESRTSRIEQNPYAKCRVAGDDADSVKFIKVDSDDEYSQVGYPHYATERMRYCSKDHQWLPRSWFEKKLNGRLLHSCRYHGANARPGPVPSRREIRAELAKLEAASLGKGEMNGVD